MNVFHILERGIRYLLDSDYRFAFNASKGMYHKMGDEEYIKRIFKAKLGYNLNLDQPRTFNEKIQWIKLNDRNDIYTSMVDKYEAKKYVANIIGKEHIIPTIGVWEKFEEVDFDRLPNEFVLKTTHGCGGIFICPDKGKMDINKAKETITKTINSNYYFYMREWPYKNVKPRIIAEEYIKEKNGDLKDYKFFCFNGKVKCFKIDFDRFVEHHANYYDPSGKLLPFGEMDYPPVFNKKIDIPKELNTMIELAEKLSTGFRFLRVDFYDVDGKILFGELTFSPAAGVGKFTPEEWDYKLGDWLQL